MKTILEKNKDRNGAKEVIATLRADDWFGAGRLKSVFPIVLPKDTVVARWIEYENAPPNNEEAKITIAIFRSEEDAMRFFNDYKL